MPGLAVLESMWNKKGGLLDAEPSVLPYLKAICQSLAWEGIRVNLVYRRFSNSYDLGLLLKEIRHRRTFQLCYIASHGQRRKLVGVRRQGDPPGEPRRALPAQPADRVHLRRL